MLSLSSELFTIDANPLAQSRYQDQPRFRERSSLEVEQIVFDKRVRTRLTPKHLIRSLVGPSQSATQIVSVTGFPSCMAAIWDDCMQDVAEAESQRCSTNHQ